MKTKNKVFALMEIAVVLCSVLLVAIPVIAAEQTMQKASATASSITTATEDDFVLGIYGNANEDDTIDMRDLTYVKLIFFGKKSETELADAKYDGKINPLDFIQIKLIIVGKEKELTFDDSIGEAVTVRKPVNRIVIAYHDSADVVRALDAADRIVGVSERIKNEECFYPELSKLPMVGVVFQPDYEAVLSVNPDIYIVYSGEKVKEFKEKLPGVTCIYLSLLKPSDFLQSVRIYGYILDKKEEAEKFISWHEEWENEVKSRTEGLSEDQKPRVFHWWWTQGGGIHHASGRKDDYVYYRTVVAGGKSIAEDLPEGTTIDAEWVITQNPDIIVLAAPRDTSGYGVDDSSQMAIIIDDILNRPELAKVKAVKNGRVYAIDNRHFMCVGTGYVISIAYFAKWFQPDLFKDLDSKAIHQEYIEFQGVDYDLDKHGVFVYHPEEHPDGK